MDEYSKLKKEVQMSNFATKKEDYTLTDKQREIAQNMNQTIQSDAVLTSLHTQKMTDNEMRSAYTNRYEEGLRQNQNAQTDRQKKALRKQAADRGESAMKMHKQLMKLSDDGTDYNAIVDKNFTLSKIQKYKGKLTPEMKAIKKTAPAVFERGLKLSHAMMALGKERERNPELYNFALESFRQAEHEWEHVKEMAEKALVYDVTIDKEKEAQQVGAYKYERAQVEADLFYADDYKERMKKKKVNWDSDDGSDGVAPSVKQVLKEQMKEVLKLFPDTTADQVESTVNEYLKRIAENAEFRIRMNMGVAGKVLNSRYHCKDGNENYNELVQKQYCDRAECRASEIISFGSLGGLTAKEFIGYGSSEDPCMIYGNVSVRLDKEAMKGNVSFVSGNSLHHYDEKYGRSAFIDEENGIAPDITMCGTNLVSIYKRARELQEKNWEGMKSSEQEAGYAIRDHGDYPYFEAHYHGTINAAQIAEVTWIAPKELTRQLDLTNMDDVMSLRDNKDFVELYENVKIINANPSTYKREGKPELKLTVWDLKGNMLTYNDLKSIFK